MPKFEASRHDEWGEEYSKLTLQDGQEWEPPEEAKLFLAKLISLATWGQAIEAERSRGDFSGEEMSPVAADFLEKMDGDLLQVEELESLDVMSVGGSDEIAFRQKEEPDLDGQAHSS